MVKRALLSVSDKDGIVDFAHELSKSGVEIISTGGTARILRDNGVEVTDVSEITNFPEMMEGRIKSLHPMIHGGVLCLRDNSTHLEEAEMANIKLIDMVVVNLYPFEITVSKNGVNLEEAIEYIDIGGPTLLRSAAKNYQSVTVISDPDDYGTVLKELRSSGSISEIGRAHV